MALFVTNSYSDILMKQELLRKKAKQKQSIFYCCCMSSSPWPVSESTLFSGHALCQAVVQGYLYGTVGLLTRNLLYWR